MDRGFRAAEVLAFSSRLFEWLPGMFAAIATPAFCDNGRLAGWHFGTTRDGVSECLCLCAC